MSLREAEARALCSNNVDCALQVCNFSHKGPIVQEEGLKEEAWDLSFDLFEEREDGDCK